MTARLISPSPHSVLSLSFYIVSDDAMAYFHTDNRDDDKSKDDDDDDDFNILLYILFCILFRVLLALKLNMLKSHPYIYFHLFYSIPLHPLLANHSGLKVQHLDVLQADWAEMAASRGGSLNIIANLPYYIVSQVLFSLADNHKAIDTAVVTMQVCMIIQYLL